MQFLILNARKGMWENGMKAFLFMSKSDHSLQWIFTCSNKDYSSQHTDVYMNYAMNLRNAVQRGLQWYKKLSL